MALLRGTLVSFDSGTWLRRSGSPWQSISGVKTTRNIASAEMVSGRAVLVETGDYSDPGDSVLCAVWS